jgi:hypothetical protein
VSAADQRLVLPGDTLLERVKVRALVAADVDDVAKPRVVIMPARAPRYCSAALVATVTVEDMVERQPDGGGTDPSPAHETLATDPARASTCASRSGFHPCP